MIWNLCLRTSHYLKCITVLILNHSHPRMWATRDQSLTSLWLSTRKLLGSMLLIFMEWTAFTFFFSQKQDTLPNYYCSYPEISGFLVSHFNKPQRQTRTIRKIKPWGNLKLYCQALNNQYLIKHQQLYLPLEQNIKL